MPSDRLDIRIDGNTSPLNSSGWLQLVDFHVGYYGLGSLKLVDRARQHEDISVANPNSLVEISRDQFQTILWKGRVTKFNPGGVKEEGMEFECARLEEMMKRRTCRWNGKISMEYNQGFLADVTSPTFDGTLNPNARWTLGEILIDVLEHAYGINNPLRAQFAGMPATSAIPLHHPDPSSVTNPYMSVFVQGPARDYLDQLVWTPAEILAALNFRIPDVSFRGQDLWTTIESIVQNGGEHGVFIDPTEQTRPRLVVHRFSNSTTVQVRAGIRGEHAESPEPRLKQDAWEFSDEHVFNTIVIEGTGTIGRTDPTKPQNDPLSGKMDRIDAAGKFWRVRNQDISPFLVGYDAKDPRALKPDEQSEIRPLLFLNGTAYTEQLPFWLAPGIAVLKTGISGDVRVQAMFEKPFQVKVGPAAGQCSQRPQSGAGSVARYPTPSGFDAFANFGLEKEMHHGEPAFTDGKRNMEPDYTGIFTKGKTGDKKDGKFVVVPTQSRKLITLGYGEFLLNQTRDDTGYMIEMAEEIQRRYRDISIKLTLTLDKILLSDLWSAGGSEIGLRKRVSLAGLKNNRWADANLQVMSVRVNVPDNEMVIECSSTVYNVTKLFPAIWRRRKRDEKQDKMLQDVETLFGGDMVADQGFPAPDGEPQMQGMRAHAHNSPTPMFVRYPGFRVHMVRVTKVASDAQGVYEGTRADEFYQDDEEFDTTTKFFHGREVAGGNTLLLIDDVVAVFPVYRDSLSIFLGIDVEQDQAHVTLDMPRPQNTFIRLTCKTEIPDDDAVEKKVGAYDFDSVLFDRADLKWRVDGNGATGQYMGGNLSSSSASAASVYARELNNSNANLHGPRHNRVRVDQIVMAENGDIIYWFDKGLTDERLEDRDVFLPLFEYCPSDSSSSSSGT